MPVDYVSGSYSSNNDEGFSVSFDIGTVTNSEDIIASVLLRVTLIFDKVLIICITAILSIHG